MSYGEKACHLVYQLAALNAIRAERLRLQDLGPGPRLPFGGGLQCGPGRLGRTGKREARTHNDDQHHLLKCPGEALSGAHASQDENKRDLRREESQTPAPQRGNVTRSLIEDGSCHLLLKSIDLIQGCAFA